MLSEVTLDSLIQPLLDEQRNLEDYVIKTIAKRVVDIINEDKDEIFNISSTIRSNNDMMAIYDKLSMTRTRQVTILKNLLYLVAKDSYNDTEDYFDSADIEFLAFMKNDEVVKNVNAKISNALAMLNSLTGQPYFKVRTPSNIFIPISLLSAYNQMVDSARTMTLLNQQTALENLLPRIEDMATNGLVNKDNEVITSKLKALANTSSRDIAQSVQDIASLQFGGNGVEISVHNFPAPDHAPVQGHIFSNEEFAKLQNGQDFEDIDGIKFKGFPRPIGAWNCRHYTMAVIISDTHPKFTKEQLQNILDRNEAGYTDSNGKHYTMYQCSQMLNTYERRIVKAQRNLRLARYTGDKKLLTKYSARVSQLTEQYNYFRNACGLFNS